MSTKSSHYLIRDLGMEPEEPVDSEWKASKRNYEGNTNMNFNELINELKKIRRKNKKNELRYMSRNVELGDLPRCQNSTLIRI